MRKPMIVIPVPNHAEQWVNARSVQHLGVGAPGTEETLEADLLAALARLDSWRDAYRRLPPPGDGAQQAAAAILGVALGR